MEPTAPIPEWLLDVLASAAVGRRERVLILGDLPRAAVLLLQRSVGPDGVVAAALASPDAPADASAPALRSGLASSRRFDAVLAAPLGPRALEDRDGIDNPVATAHGALRPGGRVLLDLPATNWSDDLEHLQPLLRDVGLTLPPGWNEPRLRQLAQAAGLRDVSVTPRTCLHALADAHELLEIALRAQPDSTTLDEDAVRLAIVELLGRRPTPWQTVLRRLRLTARR